MVKSSTKSASARSTSSKKSSRTANPRPSAKTSSRSKTLATSSKNTSSSQSKDKVVPFSPVFGGILILVCAIMIAFLIALIPLEFIGSSSNPASVPDSVQIAEEYTGLEKDNLFTYKTQEEITDILAHGTGIVFLGFPECPWCQAYAPMLNSLARKYGLSEIYYYNIAADREAESDFYKSLVEKLSDHLQFDNVGHRRIYVPNAVFVKDGEIILNDWETSKDTLGLETPEEYWTEERIEAWKSKLAPALDQLKSACGSVCNA